MNIMNQEIQYTFRDEAFLSYDAVKRGRGQEALAGLERMVAKLQKTDENTLESAYWLWAVGEHANHGGARTVIDVHVDLIADCIGRIGRFWNKPDCHWLREEEYGLFLSNLAIQYGALRSINNFFRSESAQKVCKDIRELTFSAFMKGNHFISCQGSDEVWGDIVTAAVPFGLVSAGDLAMLSSIRLLDESKIQADEAALISWYYNESGQPARAKQFLDKAAESSDPKTDGGSVLFIMAAGHLAHKVVGIGHTDDPQDDRETLIYFKHDPIGEECPYIFANNERSPRLVTVGSPITIRTFVEPSNSQLPVSLEYRVEHGELCKVTMLAGQSSEGEQYWQAELAAFSEFTSIAYRFTMESGDRERASEWYSFDVLQWMDVERVIHVEQTERHLSVYFDSPMLGGRKSGLKVTSNKETSAVSCSFTLMDNVPEDDGKLNRTVDARTSVDGSFRVGNMEVRINDSSLALSLLDEKGGVVSSSFESEGFPLMQMLTDRNGTVYKLKMNFRLTDEERLFGMGERFARMEFRGCEVDNYVFNQYKNQGFRTYFPIPFMLSTGGYGLLLQSSLYSMFRFATIRSDLLQIEADVHRERQSLSWCLFTGKPLDIVGQFTALTGRPKLPPKWAFGPWISSNNWDSEEEVDWQLAQTLKHEIPATVMVLEQWSDESTFYIFNDAGYEGKAGEDRFTYDDFTFPVWGRWPNPKTLVERIHGIGIKVLLWQAPVMKFMDGIAHWQKDEDERVMVENGYAVQNRDSSPYRIPQNEWFRGSLVPDFTNPAAAAWWLDKRQYLLDEVGIDGFKTDGGECIYGSDVLFHDGSSGAEMRNEYPNTYIQAFHNFTNRHVVGGGITFSRAGYTGAQSMPLHWAGDEKSTFEAFRSSVIAGLSCGMSGIPFWGWDLGGFSGEIPTAELFIRSTQMAAFCPVMQYHAESKGEFNMDRTPWNIAERSGKPEVLELYKRFADVRMNMLPYIYEQAQFSSRSGHPLMRAMLLSFPDDRQCLELTLQYMFGQQLLVAPVTEEGASEVDVYLPESSWLSFFGKEVLAGGRTVTIPADLSQIPVFVKENSVIPLNLDDTYELASHVGNRMDRYEQLCFMIYLTGQIDYRFADDLGNTVDMFAVKNGLRVEASLEVTGEYPITLRFRALGDAATATQNGKPLVRTTEYGQLGDGCYLQRNDEVLVTVRQGTWSIMIEL